jgi:type II secretory ATPase GspE/PulE/Tfp pilus assembly ATPase PilB-like protein
LLKGALTAAYSKRTKSGTNSSGALSLERAMNTITEQVINNKTYNGRFNGYPLVNGYDVVMRLLDSDPKSTIPSIESLGYSANHVTQQILPAIFKNAGMMVIAGSTGSGKSTALRSFIYALPDRDHLKIYGVEDPVEYLNPFMRQISVQRNSDDPEDVVKMKFLSALRSVLRMDPDVLMLGEVRDHDSASLASEFNRTGHRVFTTVHGDGCVDVLARLTSEEIGIAPTTLAAKKYLSAVMYQKLLPKLCPHCKLPAVDHLPLKTQALLRHKFGVNPATMFVANEAGCPACKVEELGLAGTKGLTVVAEILTPNDSILAAIAQRDWAEVERLWRSQRHCGFDAPDMAGKTAFEHALYKACIGLIDPNDIEADFESFTTYNVFHTASV